ncbi:MAG: DoxX family membrane protein [Planctomycetales bacterium]|nr:DoxX family membrane protein [Planctomycetales bacterium]
MSNPSAAAPSTTLLRLSLGFVFFHFGILKFFPDLSSAEMLATQTIIRLTNGLFDANSARLTLACLECLIGLGFIFNIGLRFVSALFLFHMVGTFTPVFLLPELAFKFAPFAPTLEGQYILKNVVFVAAAWTVLLPHCMPAERPHFRFFRRRSRTPVAAASARPTH